MRAGLLNATVGQGKTYDGVRNMDRKPAFWRKRMKRTVCDMKIRWCTGGEISSGERKSDVESITAQVRKGSGMVTM